MPVPSFQEHSLHVDSCLQKEHAWFVEVHVKDSPPSLNQILHLQLEGLNLKAEEPSCTLQARTFNSTPSTEH